jgi:hypothetical protein
LWLVIDADPILGLLHRVDVGHVAHISILRH